MVHTHVIAHARERARKHRMYTQKRGDKYRGSMVTYRNACRGLSGKYQDRPTHLRSREQRERPRILNAPSPALASPPRLSWVSEKSISLKISQMKFTSEMIRKNAVFHWIVIPYLRMYAFRTPCQKAPQTRTHHHHILHSSRSPLTHNLGHWLAHA
jgi:hypothetical protein